jgi:diaminopimelate decarboxylase
MRALGFSDVAELVPQIVAGPLCESSDVFTQDERGELDPRPLPRLVPGDLLAIYDVGAYAASMASNYNSQPFAAEVLVDGSSVRSIGRRQRLEELWQRELSPEKEATRVSPGSPHQPVG